MGTTRKEFEAVFPSLVDDLIQHCKQYNMPEDTLDWYRNVSHTKAVPAIALIDLQLRSL